MHLPLQYLKRVSLSIQVKEGVSYSLLSFAIVSAVDGEMTPKSLNFPSGQNCHIYNTQEIIFYSESHFKCLSIFESECLDIHIKSDNS